MIEADLSYYGLRVHGVQQEADEYSNPPMVTTTLALRNVTVGSTLRLNQFANDMTVMNKVRISQDPAVREAYEQLLTVMALTNGRVYDDDNGTPTK